MEAEKNKSTLESLFDSFGEESGKVEESKEVDIDALVKENEELKKRHLYDLAEIDNVAKHSRERIQKEKEMANASLILKLLPIIDDFNRASEHEELSDGMKAIQSKFLSTLESVGVSKMDVIGTKFDADLHEAISMVPSDESEEGTIIGSALDGYMLNGKIIRHAKVLVVGNNS